MWCAMMVTRYHPEFTAAGYVAVFADITKQHQLEQQRSALQALSHRLAAPVTLADLAQLVASESRAFLHHDGFVFLLYDNSSGKATPVPTDAPPPVGGCMDGEAQLAIDRYRPGRPRPRDHRRFRDRWGDRSPPTASHRFSRPGSAHSSRRQSRGKATLSQSCLPRALTPDATSSTTLISFSRLPICVVECWRACGQWRKPKTLQRLAHRVSGPLGLAEIGSVIAQECRRAFRYDCILSAPL